MKCPLSIVMLLGVPLALACCGSPKEQPEPVSGETYEKALAILQEESHAEDPAARAHSMESLQVSHDPRALEAIEQGLHDPIWVVRFAAAMAAGELKAARVRPVLNTMVTNDPNLNVRAGCIFALRRLGDQSHMSELAQMLKSTDPSVRADTALVLGKLGEPSAIGLLNDFANDPDVRVRFDITAALARLGDDGAQKVVASQSVEKFAEDQFRAMEVCADLPENVGSGPLLLGLRDVPPLPAGTDPVPVKFLTTQRQLIAARSLAKMKYNSERAVEVAVDDATDPDPRLRVLAYLALGEMLTSRQADPMEKMLNDTDKNAQRAGAGAVVNIYARAAIKNSSGQ